MATTFDVEGIEDRRAELDAWLQEAVGLRADDVMDDHASRVRPVNEGELEFTFNRILRDDDGERRWVDGVTGLPWTQRAEADGVRGPAVYCVSGPQNPTYAKACSTFLITVPPPGWDRRGVYSLSAYLHRAAGSVGE